MNLFGKEPQEQAMQTLIHDTNNGLGLLLNRTNDISVWLKQNSTALKEANIDTTDLYRYVEYLKTAKLHIQKSIDTYYKEFAADFPKPEL